MSSLFDGLRGWREIETVRAPKSLQPVTARVLRAADSVLDWFYPPRCYHCEAVLTGSGSRILCPACYRELAASRISRPLCSICGQRLEADDVSEALCLNCRMRKPHFDLARALFTYAGPADSLIKAFKFHGDFFLGPLLLGRAIEMGWTPEDIQAIDAVAPVPLHPWRRRERGYDQGVLLARTLARQAGWPLRARALRRIRYTSQQARLGPQQRRKNVRGAFEARAKKEPAGGHVLLVDDVMTTGATASECARMLKKSGAARVSVLTLARVQP